VLAHPYQAAFAMQSRLRSLHHVGRTHLAERGTSFSDNRFAARQYERSRQTQQDVQIGYCNDHSCQGVMPMKKLDRGGLLSDETKNTIEVVTLRPEQIVHGLGIGSPQPAETLSEAVRHIKEHLSPEEGAASWIRDNSDVMTLEQAQRRLREAHETARPESCCGKLNSVPAQN
jgi:hypothetical protein